MAQPLALFPALIDAADWRRLHPAVQRMHAEGTTIEASGRADVRGATHASARWARRLLTLPEPGDAQAISLTIERHATQERWTRRFARGRMQSTLRQGSDLRLLERLGPVTLHFSLLRDGDAIDWQLRHVRLLGVPLPRAWFGTVFSRSGARDGRYAFDIDVQLPLLGQLIAYRGWLEIDHVQ
ncbi:DUF4166 domain-containing protein [Dyella telluris]|uniref:DUF4166 domain-containing protein n=1 Tax=Dyella telluris TaxID=2763498 RepID=A0A7G8PYW9_9GAMM|nr:DUF4166 domain-containing protein [Dyella telluris]QNJ99726.1 DUF4166 domain-containing protein [Dyella telluris]